IIFPLVLSLPVRAQGPAFSPCDCANRLPVFVRLSQYAEREPRSLSFCQPGLPPQHGIVAFHKHKEQPASSLYTVEITSPMKRHGIAQIQSP
ncbi:hypothetical protein SKAU_G00250530, partial [Synaphobranchus kaupii]